jgi:hypothetical protein
MSEFLPSKMESEPLLSPSLRTKAASKIPDCARLPSSALKTSDDSKWRIGLHALSPQLGTKFEGVKLFCAKDALENAVDGDYRSGAAGVIAVVDLIYALQFRG